MSKKTWIKVKRGLLAPKHRELLGVRFWLYMYLLDKTEWETGIVYGWKDKDAPEAKAFLLHEDTAPEENQ